MRLPDRFIGIVQVELTEPAYYPGGAGASASWQREIVIHHRLGGASRIVLMGDERRESILTDGEKVAEAVAALAYDGNGKPVEA